MDKTDFKAAAKQYTSLLTLPTELLEEATELDFEAGANYCYKEITEPTIKQNAEYIEALREAKEHMVTLLGVSFIGSEFYDKLKALTNDKTT